MKFDTAANTWVSMPSGPPWSDTEGWDWAPYYETIQTADVDGDGQDELLARSAYEILVMKFDTAANTWVSMPSGPPWSDTEGWDWAPYYETIQTADVDGDGQDELLARSAYEILDLDYHAEILALTAANDGPTALGSTTTLTASMSGGTNVTYTWDFGDGNNGGGSVADHAYAAFGTYTATITATNNANSMTADTIVVVEEAISNLTATSNSPAALGNPAHFTATVASGSNVSYEWDFGDGNTGIGATPSHLYAAPGTYTAVVTATNLVSSAEATITIDVNAYVYLPVMSK